ncbi:MAG TPA: hypothetical protein VGK21_10410 [Candidatus Angelobacter sp.]|jgi:hypothetical protein
MINCLKSLTSVYLAIPTVTFLLCSFPAFAQKTLPLDNSTCNPAGQLNCLWNDHLGCFIRATRISANQGTCAPVDATGRAGIQEVSPDGTQITTTRCGRSVTVNDLCDTITNPQNAFETVTTTLNVPTPTPTPSSPQCDSDTGDGFTRNQGAPLNCSPIVVDLTGDGFSLTDAQHGVMFDIAGTGVPIQIAWTSQGSRNAFLALDRNHNGMIDNGLELFGNFTLQPKSATPNGFSALAEFDKLENGGNGDGIIDERDAVFPHLVLWVDENHDGISQSNELHSLPELGVFSLSFTYKESRRQDEFGNVFRFKAKVNVHNKDDDSQVGPMAYDVFLVTK